MHAKRPLPVHIVDKHHAYPCFEGLGNSGDERALRYREFVQSAIPAGEWELIREALQRGQLTGTERFSDEIEAIIGRRIVNRKQGRPRK